MAETIEDILEKSDKGEIIEKLAEVLDTEGCKVAIITGVPKDDGSLDMRILQTGHKYVYELYGFLREGANIVEDEGEDDS